MAADSLPRWVWLAPLVTAIAAVLAWWVWCETERGTWIGGLLILLSGVLMLAVVHESLPHQHGFRHSLAAWGKALVAGAATTGVVFVAAGLGYYIHCSPF